jgi:hypothetical protein
VKTVRFTQLVKACGKPEVHLVFSKPAKDKAFEAAVKSDRVLTVHQPSVGTAADRGEIGFKLGKGRQYLVFPKSLKRYHGRDVVGIKYDLIEAPAVTKAEAARPARKPPEKKHKTTPRRMAAQKIKEKPERQPEPPASRKASSSQNPFKRKIGNAIALLEKGKQVAALRVLERLRDS